MGTGRKAAAPTGAGLYSCPPPSFFFAPFLATHTTAMDNKPPSPGRTNLASCLVAAAFLVLVAAALAAVFFVVFRPKEPRIEVNAFRLPGFRASNGSVRFTFAQYATVRNPNRAAFSHYDSTLRLAYGGSQVGFMFIPAGEIEGGRTQYMSATFDVGSFPLAAPGSLVVEWRMKLKGKVRVLRFLTHRVESAARCRVGVSSRDGAVLGFRC